MHMYLLVTICLAAFTSTMALTSLSDLSKEAATCYTKCLKEYISKSSKSDVQNICKKLDCFKACPSGDKVVEVGNNAMLPDVRDAAEKACDGRALVSGVGVVVAQEAMLCYTKCQKYANDLTNLGNKVQSEANNEQLAEVCAGYNKVMGCIGDCPSGDKVIDVVRDMMPEEARIATAMCDGRGVGLGGGVALVPGVGVVVALMTSWSNVKKLGEEFAKNKLIG